MVSLFFEMSSAVKYQLKRHPMVCPLFWFGRRGSDGQLLNVHAHTRLVIEGYPRSGNTAAVAAFAVANGGTEGVAHHLHAPAQVIAGCRQHIPTVVLVRHPFHAVSSLVLRHPQISLYRALREYQFFYSTVRRWRHRLLLARFETIIADYNRFNAVLNRRFHTDYQMLPLHSEVRRQIAEFVERVDRQDVTVGERHDPEMTKGSPSEARRLAKQRILTQLGDVDLQWDRRRALRLYASLVRRADV